MKTASERRVPPGVAPWDTQNATARVREGAGARASDALPGWACGELHPRSRSGYRAGRRAMRPFGNAHSRGRPPWFQPEANLDVRQREAGGPRPVGRGQQAHLNDPQTHHAPATLADAR
jgi:hypothetical protein